MYLARGCEQGKALNHWLDAKLDLLLESLETPEDRYLGSRQWKPESGGYAELDQLDEHWNKQRPD
jgi:hypothetical protein